MAKPLNTKRTINAKNYLRKQKEMSVLEHVKDNKKVFFVSYRNKIFTYETENGLEFQIPLEEADGVTLLKEDKAIYFMRWLKRKFEESK